MEPKLTTIAACRVARIDRQRFNEFVAAGDYACAPETVPGRARLFYEADLIALFVFSQLIRTPGVSPKRAGLQACAVRQTLREAPDAKIAKVGDMIEGPFGQLIDRNADVLSGTSIGSRTPFSFTEFNLESIREIVREGIEEERLTFGSEDD